MLKDKEHLVALRAYQRGIVMHQLRYIDEIKPVDEIEGMDGSISSQQSSIDNNEYPLVKH